MAKVEQKSEKISGEQRESVEGMDGWNRKNSKIMSW